MLYLVSQTGNGGNGHAKKISIDLQDGQDKKFCILSILFINAIFSGGCDACHLRGLGGKGDLTSIAGG